MPSKKIPEMIGTSISTISGEAFYSHTEIEDKNGNWYDDWYTKNGEYVTHCDTEHHVFIVR